MERGSHQGQCGQRLGQSPSTATISGGMILSSERRTGVEQREHPSFGVLLRSFRRDRGWTQEELAERAGVSQDAVSTLERGTRRTPWPDTVTRLAAALDLTEEERAQFRAATRVKAG